MGKIIRGGIEYGGIPDSGKYWEGTQAQYDAITTKDPNTIYFITDSDTGNYGINDLADVNITSAANGQLLTYDSANSVWKNKAPSNRPVAYIKFSGPEEPFDWGTSGTIYLTYTITDIYGNALTFNDLVLSDNIIYDVYFVYTATSNLFQHVFPVTDIHRQGVGGTYAVSIYSSVVIGSDIYQLQIYYGSEILCRRFRYSYESKTAASGGTTLSLVTTGEKYSWNNKLDDAVRVTTSNGNFPGLVKNGQVWLISVMRISVSTSLMMLVHNYNGTIYVREIAKDSGMAYLTNNQGTVTITYSGSGANVNGAAYRLA